MSPGLVVSLVDYKIFWHSQKKHEAAKREGEQIKNLAGHTKIIIALVH